MKEQNTDISDAELIRAYLAGDMEPFNVLYGRYRRPLYAYLNKLMGSQTAADDVFQQTWVKAVAGLERYENRQKFFAWLTMIAHNLAMDAFRKSGAQAETALPEESEARIPAPAGGEPWKQMHDRELGEAIAKAVAELQPDLREVFLLRQKDVPFREIAEIQHCSVNTALGRMNYALKHLRKKLAEWA